MESVHLFGGGQFGAFMFGWGSDEDVGPVETPPRTLLARAANSAQFEVVALGRAGLDIRARSSSRYTVAALGDSQ